MQQAASGMIGFAIKGTDGELGKLVDFYFDDVTWTLRYMAVETGEWMKGKEVLISLSEIGRPDWASHVFPVALNRNQVRKSPVIQTARDIDSKYEAALHSYYSWNTYWGGGFYVLPGYGLDMNLSSTGNEDDEPKSKSQKINHNLRSMKEIKGYQIHAKDGSIGHVEDFIINKDKWDIRHLVIDMGKLMKGKKVLISPCWINSVNWDEGEVFVDLALDAVKRSPVYDPSKPFSLDYEELLLNHFRKPEGSAWVTFKLHAEPHADVYLAGTFNKWNPRELKLEESHEGLFSITVLVPEGRNEYKFIVNGTWCNSPECKDLAPNSYGTMNSVIYVGHAHVHKGHLHTFSRFYPSSVEPLWRSLG